MGDICRDLRLGHHEVQHLNTVLTKSADTGPHIGQYLLHDGEEQSVVDLVNGVVCTENPGDQSVVFYNVTINHN